MLLSAYLKWTIIPLQLISGALIVPCIILVYSAYFCSGWSRAESLRERYPLCRRWYKLAKALRRFLTAVSFKILFNHESKNEEVMSELYDRFERLGIQQVVEFIETFFSFHPLMLLIMAVSVFWTRFLIYQTDHCNIQDQDLECFFNSSGPISCSEVIELINSTYRCFKFSFDLAGAGAAAGGIFTASVVFNLILVRLFVCVRYCTTSCGLTASISCGVTAFIQLIIAIAIFVLFFIYIRLVHNIHDDSDKIIQAFAIFFCSVFCCAYPWCLVGPPHDGDQQYEEMESIRNEK